MPAIHYMQGDIFTSRVQTLVTRNFSLEGVGQGALAYLPLSDWSGLKKSSNECYSPANVNTFNRSIPCSLSIADISIMPESS